MTSETKTIHHLSACPHDGNTKLTDCGKGDHCNACGCCFVYGESNLRDGHSACLQADHKGQAMSIEDLTSQVQRLSRTEVDNNRLNEQIISSQKAAEEARAAAEEAQRQNGILLAEMKKMNPDVKTDELLAKPESPSAPAPVPGQAGQPTPRGNLPPQLR